jgi:TP901 family phage tail tape measure protein
MDTLEASLKASAVGLGETSTIADLATSAMNAYGSDTLSASGATDILTAAVREGKLEASELASSMGGVLPVASNMGVQFHEVGAAFAAMSRTGTGAAEGATQLTAILSGLLAPSQKAEDALNAMGLSSAGLKKQIKEEGLLATLHTLNTAFDANAKGAETVFPNIRALKGVLDLLGSGAETNNQIFARMTDTLGMAQTAFDATSQSAEFKMRKALGTVRESFSQLGSQLLTGLLPIFQQVTGAIQQVFSAFFNLDSGTQKLILGLGVIATVLPTIITLVGSLTTVMGVLLSPIGLVAAALAGVAFIIYKNWNEVLPVVVGLYNQFVDLYNSSDLLRGIIFSLKAAFVSVFSVAKAQVMLFVNGFNTMWKVIKEFSDKGFKGSFGDILSEGFEESKEIAKQAGEDISNALTDAVAATAGSQLEKKTVEQVQGALSNVAEQATGFVQGLIGDVGGGGAAAPAKGTAGGGDGAAPDAATDPIGLPDPEETGKKVNLIKQYLEGLGLSMEQISEIATSVGDSVANAFSNMSAGLVESLGLAENGFQGFVKGMIQTVLDLIAMMLAQSVSQAIAGATASGAASGPAAIFTTPAFIATAVGGVMSAFAAIPKFADGGIVSGTTLGMMGEYTGAKQNPEVIAPLNKLEGMLGTKQPQQVNVGGEFRIQGQDLVVALQRADRNRGRLK